MISRLSCLVGSSCGLLPSAAAAAGNPSPPAAAACCDEEPMRGHVRSMPMLRTPHCRKKLRSVGMMASLAEVRESAICVAASFRGLRSWTSSCCCFCWRQKENIK